MMDQATIDGFERVKATFETLGQELDRAAGLLDQILKGVKADPAVLVAPLKGLAIGRAERSDRAKLAELFGCGTHPRFWADESRSLSVRPDGSFLIQFDKGRMGEGGKNTGGSSWVNAWIPLPRMVVAARVSFTLTIDPNQKGIPTDFWGESMKLPGLGRWVEGQAPGGGEVTGKNFSVRPAVSNWQKDGKALRLGPYAYGQEKTHRESPVEVYAKDYPAGTLRWWTSRYGPELAPISGRKVTVAMAIDGREQAPRVVSLGEPESAGATVPRVMVLVGQEGKDPIGVGWDMALLPLGDPLAIDGIPFCFMYGGDSAKYGPSAAVTELLVEDFKVVAL